MVNLVRKSSETPNINNKDDVRMIRYAYGDYNGVVKNFGTELESTIDNATRKFKIGSGRIVLNGWEVDIDEAGWEMIISLTSGVQFYTVFLEINALAEMATIRSIFNPSGVYPEIDLGDDLTEVPSGIARLPLFSFEVHNGNITTIIRRVATIEYVKSRFESILESDGQTVKKATVAEKCVPNGSGGYSGFLRDLDNDITINNNVLRLFQKLPAYTVKITKSGGAVALDYVNTSERFRCFYRAAITNYGSTQGYIDNIMLKYAVNNGQIFTIKIPFNTPTNVKELFLGFYRESGKIMAWVGAPNISQDVEVILSNFERQVT